MSLVKGPLHLDRSPECEAGNHDDCIGYHMGAAVECWCLCSCHTEDAEE